MLRCGAIAEAAEVHDPLDAGGDREASEVGGGDGVALLVVGVAAATHRVNEIVGRRVALADRAEGARVEHVGAVYLDGRIEADPAGVACDAPNRNASRMKLAHQSAADVAGGSGDERADHAFQASARGASCALVRPAYWRHCGLASIICMTPIRRSAKPASQ